MPALPDTIGGTAADTVMAAKAPTQIPAILAGVGPDRSLLRTPGA